MVDLKSTLKDFFRNRLLSILTGSWLALIILLFILWRYLIQNNHFPIYSPIKIFPVQYTLFVAVINFALALAAAKKSLLISQLLMSLLLLITALSVLMVIYTYRFFIANA